MARTKLDGRPTTAEWPVTIREKSEIPEQFADRASAWLEKGGNRKMIHAPKRQNSEISFCYIFGYGEDEILYMRELEGRVEEFLIQRQQFLAVHTSRELLEAKIILQYSENGQECFLTFPYVPSVYYLYDPFLNWILGLPAEFLPLVKEKNHPRPKRLYRESLPMYNYSLGAYRLGEKMKDYEYSSKIHKSSWMPWKKLIEEWIEIPMERGVFRVHCYRYLTECSYILDKSDFMRK